ncbi:MAG: thienamycin biosynthesis protein ThnN [Candidatus Omnitrophota bacterium]|jgi:thienamycin biosynthesis protein ThnN
MDKESFNQRLRRILNIHLDPLHGSVYWLERQEVLGLDVLDSIHTEEDLALLGPMPSEDLCHRKIQDFVPMQYLRQKRHLMIGETGGRTGQPRVTAYFEDEFEEIFVNNFVKLTELIGVGQTQGWLWVGPSGPHLIGKAAHNIARALTHIDPFCVDFDPRWFRKLAEGSVPRKRYLEHVLEQSMQHIEIQVVDALFTTPTIISLLGNAMIEVDRQKIKAIYLGGMTIENNVLKIMKQQFKNTVILAGFGNSLCGVCDADIDLRYHEGHIDYKVPSNRLHIKLINDMSGEPDQHALNQCTNPGERGRLVFHRLDESMFLPNVCENDTALVNRDGYITDPRPLMNRGIKIEAGIY